MTVDEYMKTNRLCASCAHECKQDAKCAVLSCPRYTKKSADGEERTRKA